jgi:hypothetical protein
MAGNFMGISMSLDCNNEDEAVHVKGRGSTAASTQRLQQLRMRIHPDGT